MSDASKTPKAVAIDDLTKDFPVHIRGVRLRFTRRPGRQNRHPRQNLFVR